MPTARASLSRQAMRDVLAAMGLFAGLPREELDTLAGLAHERRVARDALVMRRGDPGDSLLVLVVGRLRAGAVSADGREVTHTMMGAGAVLGEIALLDGRARSLDVTAMQDSVLLELHRHDFLPFLLARPELMLRMMALLCDRLRRSSVAYEDVALAGLPARLARLLLSLGEEHGRPTAEGVHIRTRLSQRELSAQVAATRERVNKQLQQWKQQGLIAELDGGLLLRRPEALQALVGTG